MGIIKSFYYQNTNSYQIVAVQNVLLSAPCQLYSLTTNIVRRRYFC